jgi:hypothetical protein
VCFLTDTFYVLPCLPNQCKIASFEIGCSFEDVEKIQLFIVQKATCSQKLFLRKQLNLLNIFKTASNFERGNFALVRQAGQDIECICEETHCPKEKMNVKNIQMVDKLKKCR